MSLAGDAEIPVAKSEAIAQVARAVGVALDDFDRTRP
jgi:hypothetical protein